MSGDRPAARDVIADHLPAMAHCFEGFTKVNVPHRDDLLAAADEVIRALNAQGYALVDLRARK